MSKMNEIARARGLLTQALSVALNSMPTNKSVLEAKTHMQKALTSLDKVTKEEVRKKSMSGEQFKTWWGNVMGGTSAVAHQPMSAEARTKSLAQLNAMIAEEQKKIDEIEKKVQQTSSSDELLSD